MRFAAKSRGLFELADDDKLRLAALPACRLYSNYADMTKILFVVLSAFWSVHLLAQSGLPASVRQVSQDVRVDQRGGATTVGLQVSEPTIFSPLHISNDNRATVSAKICCGKSKREKIGGYSSRVWLPGTLLIDVEIRSASGSFLDTHPLTLEIPYRLLTSSGISEEHVLKVQVQIDKSSYPRSHHPVGAKDLLLIPVRILEGVGEVFITCPLEGRCSS